MSALLRSCSCIILGGGICSVPFLNLSRPKSNIGETNTTHNLGGVDSASSQVTTSGSSSENTETGNCSLNSGTDEVFAHFSGMSTSHIAFSCDNSGSGDAKINSKWTIWVPVKLLKNPRTSLKGEKKVNIKTQTSNIEEVLDGIYDSTTTFESDIFNSPIKGIWGAGSFISTNSDDDRAENKVYRVKISDSESEDDPIFLRLK